MRRFLITSSKFTGHVELIYKENGLLSIADISKAELDVMQTQGILLRLNKAINVDHVATMIENSSATLVEADFEVTFDMFWLKYDKKINRKRAAALWEKMNKAEQVKAFYSIAPYDKYLTRENWRSKADPDTFLRNRYWENEYK